MTNSLRLGKISFEIENRITSGIICRIENLERILILLIIDFFQEMINKAAVIYSVFFSFTENFKSTF